MTLSKSTNSVQQALLQQGFDWQIMPASTRTAVEAAQTIGCEVAQIIKSLIFKIVSTNEPLLVLTSGINRVNETKVAEAIGQKIVKSDADFVRQTTGFAIGGIPPIGHLQKIETLIDEDLFKFEQLWAAAGTPNTVFMLPTSALVQLTDGDVIAVK